MPNLAILEDNDERVAAMKQCLAEANLSAAVIFDNAPEMLAWLAVNLSRVSLLSLDNDLDPERFRDRQHGDPGSGCDVADFLRKHPPTFPIIIHTSNSNAAASMTLTFEECGWRFARVVPYNDVEWVRQAWIVEVKKALTS